MATSCDSCKLYQDLACLALYSEQALCRISSCSSPLVELVVKDIVVTLDIVPKAFPSCHLSQFNLLTAHLPKNSLGSQNIIGGHNRNSLCRPFHALHACSLLHGNFPHKLVSLLSFFIRCLLNASQYYDVLPHASGLVTNSCRMQVFHNGHLKFWANFLLLMVHPLSRSDEVSG
jgi:hypothetical protein